LLKEFWEFGKLNNSLITLTFFLKEGILNNKETNPNLIRINPNQLMELRIMP